MLVEDNELNQQVATMTLSHFGLKVEVANNGKEAVEMLSTEAFDIVLMDVQMPIMDGYEASRTIRNELHLEVPIIALTANALKGESEGPVARQNKYISWIKSLQPTIAPPKTRPCPSIHLVAE